MTGDAMWYEAAQVVGITNALNVAADTLGVLGALDETAAPAEVRAIGVPVLTRKIDIANARLAFPSGLVANLTASRVSAKKVRKCRIFAPSLYVSIDMQARAVRAFRLTRDGGSPQIVPMKVAVEDAEPLAREIEDFAAAVRQRRPPLVSGEIGREALALAEEVLAAIEEHHRAVEGGSR